MEKNLVELLEKEIVTLEELEEIECFEEVTEVENCGNSGKHIGCTWFNVKAIDGEEYSIYVKQGEE